MRLKHIIKGVPVIPALLLALTLSGLVGCGSSRENDASDKTPVLWSLRLNSGYSQPSDIYGDVAVGIIGVPEGDNGVLTFVDLDEQEVIWQGEDGLGLVVNQTMVSNGANWFVNNDDLRQVEVYRNSGVLVGTFEYDLENGVNLSGLRPVVVGDVLYIAQGRGLYTFDISQADTLNLLWSKELPYALSSLAANEGGIYAGTRNDTQEPNVFKLDAATGEIMWEATTYEEVSWEPRPPASLAIKGTRLFANASNTMQAFDTDSGERAWLSEPVVCGEYDSSPGDVFSFGRHLHLLHKSVLCRVSGAKRWQDQLVNEWL